MFDRIVRRFLDHTFEPKPPALTAPKQIIYFCLSFTGIHSLQIRTQISRLCHVVFPHLDITFVFRSSRRISSFFPFKDKVPKYLRSSVVYLFKCRCCSASYVAQTTRHLHTRMSEHLGISLITEKQSTYLAICSIFSHINVSEHPANFDDFQILSSSFDSYELMIHESLLISKYKPRAVARTLIGGGGCIFIYSGSARLTSFEINFISKETSRAEPEYMNIHPPPPPN